MKYVLTLTATAWASSIIPSANGIELGSDMDLHLYGQLHLALVSADKKDMDIANEGHRLGARGSSKLESGAKAFFNFETEYLNDSTNVNEIDTDDNDIPDTDVASPTANESTDQINIHVRHANMGFEGSLGTITIGRQNNPYNATYTSDVFQRNSGWAQQAAYRIGDAVVYSTRTTPSGDAVEYGGYVGVMVHGINSKQLEANQRDIDSYHLGGNFNFGHLKLDGGLFNLQFDDSDAKQVGMSFGMTYSVNYLYMGLNYETLEHTDTNQLQDDIQVLDYAVKYKFKNVSYGIGYGVKNTEPEGGDRIHENRVVFEAEYHLAGNIVGYIGAADYNKESSTSDNVYLGLIMTF